MPTPDDFVRFVMTDEECVIGGLPYSGIPVFFSRNGVITPFSDYMIHMRVKHRTPESTAETYAYHLQKWQKHLMMVGVQWDRATDGTLIAWRDMQLDVEKLEPGTVSGYLQSAFSFYLWAEEQQVTRGNVAIYGDMGKRYRISARRVEDGRYLTWVWPYLPTVPRKPNRHTPTSQEIERVHGRMIQTGTGTRDSLLISFYEEAATRRAEALQLEVGDIPSWKQIEKARDSGETFTIKIVGKGGKVRYVPVLPDLMGRARDYIEGSRSAAVQAARNRNSRYKEPADLFLGENSGRALNKQYVSRLISRHMRSAGIERASGHRIRARGLTNIVTAFDGYHEDGQPFSSEMILWKAADIAGHADPEYLRPYLNLSRAPGAESLAAKIMRGESRLRDLSVRIEEKCKTLEKLAGTSAVIEAIRSGQYDKIELLLRALSGDSTRSKRGERKHR